MFPSRVFDVGWAAAALSLLAVASRNLPVGAMLYRALVLAMCASQSAALKVFVSGAGGQTGQSVFRKMLARPEFSPVGVVRSEESKAALVESGVPAESVVVCDVTDAEAVMSAMKGCEAVVIATSAKPAPTGEMKESGGPIFGCEPPR